jgi:hypothetical protein
VIPNARKWAFRQHLQLFAYRKDPDENRQAGTIVFISSFLILRCSRVTMLSRSEGDQVVPSSIERQVAPRTEAVHGMKLKAYAAKLLVKDA